MKREYLYCVLKASWGISVRLTAEALPLSAFAGEVLPISPLVSYAAQRLTSEERKAIERGLGLVATKIQAQRTEPVVICIMGLKYSLCDYQPEGITCAIMEWSAQEFDFTLPTIPVWYDKMSNRYNFAFDNVT